MTDSGLSWESIGEYKLYIGSGVIALVGGALAVISPMIIGGVLIGGVLASAVFYLGKKAFDEFEKSRVIKWLQTQLESDTVSAELKEKYLEILTKLIIMN